MQLFSEKFKQFAKGYLDSSNICIATFSKVYTDNFIEQVKNRDDVIIVEISEENRETVVVYLQALISKIIKAKKYVADPERFFISEDIAVMVTDHGIRNLVKLAKGWICSCDFYKEHQLCSHIIALEEYLKNK